MFGQRYELKEAIKRPVGGTLLAEGTASKIVKWFEIGLRSGFRRVWGLR